MKRRTILAAPALWAGATLPARAAEQPVVVVELFTSQSCSACVAAEALLGELARDRPDVLPLAFHVTYWDGSGWRDRFSLREANERQRRYSSTLANSRYRGQVVTPQFVVQGLSDAAGSDRDGLLAAIDAARAAPRVPLTVTPHVTSVTIEVGQGTGVAAVWLVGYDSSHETEVLGGENSGRKLIEVNVVRSLAQVGAWLGQPLRVNEPKPQGQHIAVLLQAAGGGILGAAKA